MIAVVALFAIGGALAANQIIFPQTATVNQVTDIKLFINSTEWQNNTQFNWGQLDRGTTYMDYFEILNNGNINITNGHLLFFTSGLPVGWTETYSLNDTLITLVPQASVSGELTLTVPFDAVPGVYNWTSYVSVT